MFSERLKEARAQVGISQKELASRLFISQQAYAKYEVGSSTPNPEMLKNIADELEITTDYLTGKQTSSPQGVKIPVLGEVQAGLPIEAVENIIDYEEIDEAMASRGDYFALQVRGDSMEPKFSQGDVVIVRKQPTVDEGDIGIFLVNGDCATIKKFSQHKHGIALIPLNPNHNLQNYSNKDVETLPVICLGKVVELRAKF